MLRDNNSNINISSEKVLVTPQALKAELPVSESALQIVQTSRQVISDILHRKDHRFLLICGPCSIHDIDAAKEYALKLKELHESCKDT
jgi:3-deoxy-7-phosphoheptulonate synthase